MSVVIGRRFLSGVEKFLSIPLTIIPSGPYEEGTSHLRPYIRCRVLTVLRYCLTLPTDFSLPVVIR